MPFQNLSIENKGRIQYIIINRENKLNALNHATLVELHSAIDSALKNEAADGIILTGAGKKAFVAGADIAEFAGIDIDGALKMVEFGHNIFNIIENAGKPIIAAINGFALGGGPELALACHIRIAVDTAKMGLPEVSLGLIPGYGGTQRLTSLVGKGKAMEMILTGDVITADAAYQYGLVNKVVNQENLLSCSEEMLSKILSRAPKAVSLAISAINASQNGLKGFDTEMGNFSKCFGTNDLKEGISAFTEKRKPIFTGK